MSGVLQTFLQNKKNSFGWISYINGTGNQASNSQFFADGVGNTYMSYKGGTSADYSACARIDPTGTTATYLRPYADDFLSVNIPAHSSFYTGSGAFFTSARASDLLNYPYSTLNSSLGYQSGKKKGGGLTNPETAAITPDGRIYVLGRTGSKTQEGRIITLDLSGNSVGGWATSAAYASYSAIAPRTDNSAWWIWKTGPNLYWCGLPAGGGAATINKQVTYAWSDGGYALSQAATDSSNNLYAITSQGRIFKVDSSGNSIISCFVNTTEQYGGVQAYGSLIYVLTSNTAGTELYIRAYNSSLTPQWQNTIYFSGVSSNIYANVARFAATSEGLFMCIGNTTYGNFIMKLPLTGVPNNSSKALTGPVGLTLNWAVTTFSVNTLAFGSIIGSGVMNVSGYSPTADSSYPSGATTAPANTNTSL